MSRRMTAANASFRNVITTSPTIRAVSAWRTKLKNQASIPVTRMLTTRIVIVDTPCGPSMWSSPQLIRTGKAACISEASTIVTATSPMPARAGLK